MKSSIVELIPSSALSSDIALRAKEALLEQGIPSKSEDYRFTNCEKLIAESGLNSTTAKINEQQSQEVVITSLAKFAANYSDLYSRYFATHTSKLYGNPKAESCFTQKNNIAGGMFALSDATVADGSVIYLKRGAEYSGEIDATGRVLIILERDAKADITLLYRDIDGKLQNNVVEIIIGDGAKLSTLQDMHSMQDSIVNGLVVTQGRDSLYSSVASTIGCQSVRNNIIVDLNSEGAQAHLYGVNITNGSQVSDHYTLINHNAPNCKSDELYKNIVADSSTISFQGNIYVKKGADGTSAEQLSRNLVLNTGARAYSKPHLEIYADEVKCTHAATTGQMDSEALFYIMQRGISKNMAQRLQVYGFAADIINKIENIATQDRLKQYIEEIL